MHGPLRRPQIRIGTAGWAIPRASASAFPAVGTHLVRYAARFDAVEINSSFHRAHRPATYARWAASVPAGFRFSVKLPKTISHTLRLAGADAHIAQFMTEVSALGETLGCVLVQLPPSLAFDDRMARAFFATVRRAYDGPLALEPRHPSWSDAAASAVLGAHAVTRVAADPLLFTGADAPVAEAPLAYFRLHGWPRVYYSTYSPEALDGFARRVREAHAAGLDVWCMFDNTAHGAATANALAFDEALR